MPPFSHSGQVSGLETRVVPLASSTTRKTTHSDSGIGRRCSVLDVDVDPQRHAGAVERIAMIRASFAS
jgi:hypothetical protein